MNELRGYPLKTPLLTFAGLSDVGLSRPNNEDVWAALPELGFFALADGMGGHQAGEVAAKMAIDQLCGFFAEHLPDQNSAIALQMAIEKANSTIYAKGQKSELCNGMGTTLCCLYWTQDEVIYAHVGDSRIYRLRERRLVQLTEDHSLYMKLKSLKKCPSDNASFLHKYKNVITRAVGTTCRANPEIAITSFLPEDLFVLCSDGLSDALSLQDMQQILLDSNALESAASHLIEKAKIKGSNDNITVLLIKNCS